MIIDIPIDVLKAHVRVILGKGLKKQTAEVQRQFSGRYLARCAFAGHREGVPFFCVIHSKTSAMSVVAHEAVHAANFILDGMGCVADFDNDEVQAYIVQYILEAVEERQA